MAVRAKSFGAGLLNSESRSMQVCSSTRCIPSERTITVFRCGCKRFRASRRRAGHSILLTIDRNFAPVDRAKSQKALHVLLNSMMSFGIVLLVQF